MSTTGLPEVLTAIERATYIVDHAEMPLRPHVDDDGVVTPVDIASPLRLVHEAIEARIRPDKRGVKREGLTVRLFLILLITCAWLRRIWVCDLHTLATEVLPLEIQRELGILHWVNKDGQPKLRTITEKQLYRMVDVIRKHLDVDPALELPAEQVADRLQFLDDCKDGLLYTTHVLATTGTAVAIDETGVWSWMRGPKKPDNLPLADPTDEDTAAAAEIHRSVGDIVDVNKKTPTTEPDQMEEIDPDTADTTSDEPDDLADEDDPDLQQGHANNAATENRSTTATAAAAPAAGSENSAEKKQRLGKRCWFGGWGVKTHKTGKRSSYFGYSTHTLVAVPDAGRGGKRASKAERYREPLLVEEFAVTRPSTDVVEPSIAMVKKRFARGRPVVDLLGDRHYSYKKADRWVLPLWRMKVRPVLDLREKDHGPIAYEGAIIIDGTPHLDPPANLRELKRPGKGASQAERDEFAQKIAERQKYAFKRRKTAWSRNDGKPGGDGNTRWESPVVLGTIACPHAGQDAVDTALEYGQPTIDPKTHEASLCTGGPLWIPAGVHMKLHQEEYWGSPEWLISWNRRTYVEGAFGLMKNYTTGNIHRGWSQFTGQALVTLGLTAVLVAYNLRELENWYIRASKHCPDNPLLAAYAEHPLHQTTKWVHGHSVHTAESRAEWDQKWFDEITSDTAAGDAADAA